MALVRNLAVGVVSQKNVRSELLLEILDHQGICYEEIHAASKNYPAVLVPDDLSQDSILIAREACALPENVIIASRIADLTRVLSSLSGLDDRQSDRLDLVVNDEEEKVIAAIKEALGRLGLPLVRKWFWPNSAKACCVLSHDIDWLTYSPFHAAVFQGKLGAFRMLKLAINSIFRRRDFGWNIPEIMEMEAKRGFKSSFYFQTSYEKGQDLAEHSMKTLVDRQFEVGLHGYHGSHKDATALRSELQRFRGLAGIDPEGIRYHILKFAVPKTWILECEAGLKYDATFAYNEYYGFRSGVCFPYHPFNGKMLPITEIPTGYMDWTSLNRRDRGEKAKTMLNVVKKGAEKYHGVLVVDFHNTYLNEGTFPDIYGAYESLLTEISKEDYWVATAAACAKWWRKRADARPNPKLGEEGKPVFETTCAPLIAEYEDKTVTLA